MDGTRFKLVTPSMSTNCANFLLSDPGLLSVDGSKIGCFFGNKVRYLRLVNRRKFGLSFEFGLNLVVDFAAVYRRGARGFDAEADQSGRSRFRGKGDADVAPGVARPVLKRED